MLLERVNSVRIKVADRQSQVYHSITKAINFLTSKTTTKHLMHTQNATTVFSCGVFSALCACPLQLTIILMTVYLPFY